MPPPFVNGEMLFEDAMPPLDVTFENELAVKALEELQWEVGKELVGKELEVMELRIAEARRAVEVGGEGEREEATAAIAEAMAAVLPSAVRPSGGNSEFSMLTPNINSLNLKKNKIFPITIII